MVDCEDVVFEIEYEVENLELSTLNDLNNIKYNYGSAMGEISVNVSHPIAKNYSYAWYKLKNDSDLNAVNNNEINNEILDQYFESINNNSNKLSIINCNESGFYVVKVETTITDIDNNEVDLVKYSNIVSVTTEKLRSYFVEAPTYLATTGDLVKDIEFTNGKVVTETGVVVAGEIRAININDEDVVDEDGIMVEFVFVPSDLNNFYFDQSEDDSVQNYQMNIVKNCYVYTFIYKDNTKVVINVEQGKAIKFPELTTGSGSWKLQGVGKYFNQNQEYVVGETASLEVKDLVFMAA